MPFEAMLAIAANVFFPESIFAVIFIVGPF